MLSCCCLLWRLSLATCRRCPPYRSPTAQSVRPCLPYPRRRVRRASPFCPRLSCWNPPPVPPRIARVCWCGRLVTRRARCARVPCGPLCRAQSPTGGGGGARHGGPRRRPRRRVPRAGSGRRRSRPIPPFGASGVRGARRRRRHAVGCIGGGRRGGGAAAGRHVGGGEPGGQVGSCGRGGRCRVSGRRDWSVGQPPVAGCGVRPKRGGGGGRGGRGASRSPPERFVTGSGACKRAAAIACASAVTTTTLDGGLVSVTSWQRVQRREPS